jgi:hypothetical protein
MRFFIIFSEYFFAVLAVLFRTLLTSFIADINNAMPFNNQRLD